MLLKKAAGVSCCDIAAETVRYLPVTKKAGTCHASRKPTASLSISPCQRERRNEFTNLTSLWTTLTAGQKSDWLTLAQNTPFVNECEEVYYLSAFNMFSKVNGVLLSFGPEYMLADAPGSYDPPGDPVNYSINYEDVPYSAYDCLFLTHADTEGIKVQIFSHPGKQLPAGFTVKYFKMLSAGVNDSA